MRYKLPRWVGLATLLITATRLGIPAFAQEFEAGDELEGECVNGPPGLFASDCQTLANGVTKYEPAYGLWSDDAAKDRYVFLPDGAADTIDAADPNRWVFPVGTRLYKTFLRTDRSLKYETRLIKKESTTKWSMTTYAWDRDQKVATLTINGQENVFGDDHDIPTQAQCSRCHNSPERVLGFSAIQLSPSAMLGDLARSGRLINWANAEEAKLIADAQTEGLEAVEIATEQAIESYRLRATIQGDLTQTEAVGYLHANCGHCHGGPFPAAGMSLFSQVLTELPAQSALNGIAAAICEPNGWAHPNGTTYVYRIHPSNPGDSSILGRMGIRDPGPPTAFKPNQMPPLATEKADTKDGIVKVTNWINSLADTCTPAQPEVEAPDAVF